QHGVGSQTCPILETNLRRAKGQSARARYIFLLHVVGQCAFVRRPSTLDRACGAVPAFYRQETLFAPLILTRFVDAETLQCVAQMPQHPPILPLPVRL